jgi:hypothetical protein
MTVEFGVLLPTREAVMSGRLETGPILAMAERGRGLRGSVCHHVNKGSQVASSTLPIKPFKKVTGPESSRHLR